MKMYSILYHEVQPENLAVTMHQRRFRSTCYTTNDCLDGRSVLQNHKL